jgi:hypothetical protein
VEKRELARRAKTTELRDAVSDSRSRVVASALELQDRLLCSVTSKRPLTGEACGSCGECQLANELVTYRNADTTFEEFQQAQIDEYIARGGRTVNRELLTTESA